MPDDKLAAGLTTLRLKSAEKPAEPPYKRELFEQQEGPCNGCKAKFEFSGLEVDRVIPRVGGGGDHIENLQLLCGHCNRVKGDRPQAYLVARLREMGIAA